MGKSSKLFSAAAALLLFIASALPAAGREVITNYDVDIRIAKDSSMTVTENITATVEHVDISRGIIRVFPVEYRDDKGRTVRVGFDVLDVKIDGKATKSVVSSSGRYREVRIGDPDRVLPRGSHTFTITYKTTRQLGFFENHDELYWNVTGNDWLFPILSASCRVALPGKDFGEGFNTIEWYAGAYGSKGDWRAAMLLPDGTVSTTMVLGPRMGLTVAFTWPKGLVTPPPPLKGENSIVMTVIGAAVLLSVSVFVWRAVRRWGQNPPEKAVIPLFYPPDDIGPGYARYLHNGFKLDQTSFAAELLGLAVKGAIKIKENEGNGIFSSSTIELVKEGNTPQNLTQSQTHLLKQLFPSGTGGVLTLKQSNRTRLSNARGSLWGFLSEVKRSLIVKNTSKLLPAAAIYIGGIAALYPFSGDFFPVTATISIAGGIGVMFLGIAGSGGRPASSGRTVKFIKRLIPAALVGAIVVLISRAAGFNPIPALIFIAAAGVISAAMPMLTTLTQEGSDLINGTDGLRLYMAAAEKSRLEMLNPPEETPQLFERLLPYALALDVAKTWADRFEKILTEAQYEPTWYVGPSPHVFITGNGFNSFSSNLQSQMTSSMRSPSSTPGSSSGMGGGGFSGGGGGGGGGRGW